MSRKLKKMLLCLLLIAALCVVYELWLAALSCGIEWRTGTGQHPGGGVRGAGNHRTGQGRRRNGVLYRDVPTDRECLVLYRDGTMDTVRENTTSGQALLDAGAWNVLSFGPALVEDGKAREGLKEAYKVDGLNVSISGPEPRTAIGYLGPNHFLILVVDGRQTGYSRGMDFEELAKVFVEHGCTLAYNLDGGGSVTLYQDGEIVNSPCPLVGKERNISDILYVEAGEQ